MVGRGQGRRGAGPWAFPTGPGCVFSSSSHSAVLPGATSAQAPFQSLVVSQSNKKLRPALTDGRAVLYLGSVLPFRAPSVRVWLTHLSGGLQETCPSFRSLPGTKMGGRGEDDSWEGRNTHCQLRGPAVWNLD